jgi:hypothetical protein
MKTVEVGYKTYYHEFSDWCIDLIKARNEKAALRKFAKLHQIEESEVERPQDWKWWEGDWFNALAYVKPVTVHTCPLCHGQGQVSLE